jgi:hypothetical protein
MPEPLPYVPWDVALAAPMTQPIVPRIIRVFHHHLQHLVITSDAVVLIVTTQLQAECLVLLHHILVPVIPAPLPERLHGPAEPLSSRRPFDNPKPLARFGPEMGKAEKIECAVSIILLLTGGWPLEPNQRRLLRVYGELKEIEPFWQRRQHPPGIVLPFAADKKIVGKAGKA